MKRLVLFFDGTWNSLSSIDHTNVVKLAASVSASDGDIEQIVYYDEGVGAETA